MGGTADTGAAAPTALESLARLAHSVRFEDLPADVVALAKDRLLDTLGCAFGAEGSDVARFVRAFAAACGGHPQATLIGTGEKVSAPLATLVNGTLLRFLDGNDYYFARDPAHPSGNVAAALAVAERHGRDGRALVAAVVAAYEIHLRLCDFAGAPAIWSRGWHHGTNAQFSSAAAAALLSGCDVTATAHAMAIAGSHHNTLAQLQSGAISMIKASAEAWVAKGGVEAALFAGCGMTGPLNLMEGAAGWAARVAGEVDLASLCAPLDGRFRIRDTSVKPYPVVASAVAPVRAAIALHERGLADPGAIRQIRVRLPAFVLGTPSCDPSRRYPAGIESAQHSLFYCTAVALRSGACGDAEFAADAITSPGLRDWLAKVELEEDASLTARWPGSAGATVSLHLGDGSVQTASVPDPPGSPRDPLGPDALAAKYHGYADPHLTPAGAARLRDAVLDLENCKDVAELAALFGRPAPRPQRGRKP